MPPARPIDPRLLIDGEGQTPFMRARSRNHITLVNILNPFTPLAEIFDHMEVRIVLRARFPLLNHPHTPTS